MSGQILVSCTLEERALPYVEALERVGVTCEAIRVVSPQSLAPADAAALAAGAAGLLLCGGPDLEPHHYGEATHPDAKVETVPARDAVELELLAGAREARTPLLGVCRGLQMVNAFLGGTLWQDIPLMWPGAVLHDLAYPRDALIHPVIVERGLTGQAAELGAVLASEVSLVNHEAEPQARRSVGQERRDHPALLVNHDAEPQARRSVGQERRDHPALLVNSRHHQAIKALAPGLVAVAAAPDGILEAVAGDDPAWWLWAVQWHPENLVSLPSQRRLFARFREAVETRAARQGGGGAGAARAADVAVGEPALR